MIRQIALQSSILTACWFLAGCGQAYTGAWRGPLDEPAPAPAVQPAAADTVADSQYSTNNAVTPVKSTNPATVRMKPAAGTSGTSGPAGRSINPLGLYGQVDAGVPKVSPLDSADNLTQVSFATEGADFDPAISPNGTQIVFASTRHRKTSDIYLQKIDGTTVTQLTDDPADDVMPAFSPDGKRLAFASNRTGNYDIYLMDVAGGKAEQLTTSASHEIHPSFSADGKRLVFSSFGQQSGQWEMVVIDLDKPASKKFIGYGLFPHWSPTGDRIVFQKARERGTKWFSIWTVDIEGGEAVRPTEIAASSNAACITPHWSPDGKQIVFCTVVNPASEKGGPIADAAKPAEADLWLINADGSGRTNLTRGKFMNVQPVWGKAGGIYFVSNRSEGGLENIWSLKADRPAVIARPDAGTGDTRLGQVPTSPE